MKPTMMHAAVLAAVFLITLVNACDQNNNAHTGGYCGANLCTGTTSGSTCPNNNCCGTSIFDRTCAGSDSGGHNYFVGDENSGACTKNDGSAGQRYKCCSWQAVGDDVGTAIVVIIGISI